MSNEGFAQDWLDFESEIGTRLLLRGPIETVNDQFLGFGALLMKHITFPTPDPTVKIEDKEIAPNLKVRVYTPPNHVGNKPVVVFYHGGGWAMGDLNGEDYELREMCRDTGLVIVSTEYRLAPQNPYPAGLDDCITAYKWVLQSSSSLNTMPNQVITCGTSAGGNLALAVALKLIDAGESSTLKGVVTIAPVTVMRDAVPEELKSKYTSYDEHSENTVDTAEAMKAFVDAYNGDSKDPYISVLLHKRIKDLPKVYIAWAGQDTLRDDARLFKAALDDAKVPNLSDEYLGYPHWFWGYPSKHLTEIRKIYFSNIRKGFEFVLS